MASINVPSTAPITITVAGLSLTTSSVTTALDLVDEASRRARPGAKLRRPSHPRSTPESAAHPVPSPTAIPDMLAQLAIPARHRHLRVLHRLQAHAGRYVSREDLAVSAGFTGLRAAKQLGGICTAIIRIARTFGVEPSALIERSSLGYCAGSLLIATALPDMTPLFDHLRTAAP